MFVAFIFRVSLLRRFIISNDQLCLMFLSLTWKKWSNILIKCFPLLLSLRSLPYKSVNIYLQRHIETIVNACVLLPDIIGCQERHASLHTNLQTNNINCYIYGYFSCFIFLVRTSCIRVIKIEQNGSCLESMALVKQYRLTILTVTSSVFAVFVAVFPTNTWVSSFFTLSPPLPRSGILIYHTVLIE